VINFLMNDSRLRENPARPPGAPLPAGAAADDPFFSQVNIHNLCQEDTLALLPRIRSLMDEYPGTTTLAEISSAEDTLAASADYVRGGQRLHMAYNSSLMTDEALTARRVTELIARVEALFDGGVICWTGGTHDFPRLTSRWRRFHPPEAFAQDAFDHLFAALIVCLRGSCCIYQGDELGLTQADIPHHLMQDPFGIRGYPRVLGRDGSRTPMPWTDRPPNHGFTTASDPWLPIPADHGNRAVAVQAADAESLLNKYRRLIHWRGRQPALLEGDLELLEFPGELVGFVRGCAEQRLLCLFNLGSDARYQSLAAFPGYRVVTGLDVVDRSYRDTVEIPPFGVFLAELPATDKRPEAMQ